MGNQTARKAIQEAYANQDFQNKIGVDYSVLDEPHLVDLVADSIWSKLKLPDSVSSSPIVKTLLAQSNE